MPGKRNPGSAQASDPDEVEKGFMDDNPGIGLKPLLVW